MSAAKKQKLDKTVEHKNIRLVREAKEVGCKKHGDSTLITDVCNGDIICEKCGRVVTERLPCDEAEWRTFEGDTEAEKWSKNRAGDAAIPYLSEEFNLGTTIKAMDQKQDETYGGNIVRQFKRRSVDNALNHYWREIDEMGERIHLPKSVVSSAKALYAQMYMHIKLKGNISLVDMKAAAALYIACRNEQVTRTTKEIAAIYGVPAKDLKRAIKRIFTTLKVEKVTTSGAEMINRFSAYLGITRDERKKARAIAKEIDKRNRKKLAQPETVAGTSLYLAIASTRGKFHKTYILENYYFFHNSKQMFDI